MIESRKTAAVVGMLVAAFIVLVLTMDLELNIFDEGLILVDAMRALAGELVHRDYYANYAPGMSYLVAMMFVIFGKGFLPAALLGIAIMAGIAAAIYGLLIGRVRTTLALTGPGAFICWVIANPAYLYPSFPCALLALLACAILTRPDALRRTRPLLLAGGCAGVAAFMRYDTGFFLLIAVCAAIAICLLAREGRRGFGPMIRGCLLCASGAGIVFLPGAIAFIAVASPRSFFDDIIAYALHYYSHTRHLPFPTPWNALAHPDALAVYFPIGTVLFALPAVIADIRSRTDGRSALPLTLLLECLTIILYYKGIVRPVPLHMMLAIVPAIPLAIIAADRYLAGRLLGTLIAAGLLATAILPPVYAAAQTIALRPARRMPLGRMFAVVPVDRDARAAETCAATPWMRGAMMKPYYARAARFLAENSTPGERIFVGVTRNDHIYVNPIALYFAADRMPMTHWAQFDPGLQTRADIQTLMVGELQAARPRWVVRDGSTDWVKEPNDSALNSGVRLVDTYLDAHYRPVARADLVIMWLRNDVPAPRLDTGPMECRMSAPAAG